MVVTTTEPVVLARFFVPGLPARPATGRDARLAVEMWSGWLTKVGGFADRAGIEVFAAPSPIRLEAVVRYRVTPGSPAPGAAAMERWGESIRTALYLKGIIWMLSTDCRTTFEPLVGIPLAELPRREGVEITIMGDDR